MNEIQSVKIQGEGYLLNGIMSVPKADGNKEYELIKQWLAEGNTPEPEFTEEELNNNIIDEIKAEAGRIITERYPSFKQVNAQLGIYGAEYLATMTAFITDIKTQSDVLELDAAKTKNDFVVGA